MPTRLRQVKTLEFDVYCFPYSRTLSIKNQISTTDRSDMDSSNHGGSLVFSLPPINTQMRHFCSVKKPYSSSYCPSWPDQSGSTFSLCLARPLQLLLKYCSLSKLELLTISNHQVQCRTYVNMFSCRTKLTRCRMVIMTINNTMVLELYFKSKS